MGAVVGAGVVRTADLGAGQAEPTPLPDDPTAAYAVAANNTADANYRRTVRSRNASDPDDSFRTISRSGVDHDDRQAYVYLHGEDLVIGGYYDEGVVAMRNGVTSMASLTSAPLARQDGDWRVVAAPGYGVIGPAAQSRVPDPAVDWTLAERTESTLVYRVDDGEEIRTVVPRPYRGMEGELAADSEVTVTVDRKRGVLTGATYRLYSRETGERFVYEVEYEAVGTADLRRPEAIGPRTPVERLWDALDY